MRTLAALSRRLAPALAAAALGPLAAPAGAQEYGVYLLCKGEVRSGDQKLPGQIDLALRRNSSLALVQSSDVLPAGEKLKLQITPQFYTITWVIPARASALWYDWWHGRLFVWAPHLHKLHTVRMSVNRQTAALQGEMRDGADRVLASLAMTCTPSDNEAVPEPKF